MSKKLKAKKVEGYLLEPLFDKVGATWQAHHVTNPAAFRPSFDKRVYLGYRAGGDRDHYCINKTDVWSSSLGLAILDEKGERVLYRFPYPIMKIIRSIPLPQAPEQYEPYLREHEEKVVVLHDFRLYEYNDFIYVIYHDGNINKAFDCVKKMRSDIFQAKVEESVRLMERPAAEIEKEWHDIWWQQDVWENAGVDGTRLIYPSDNNKNDIIFFKLKDNTMQMCHRPLPDMAVTIPEGDFFVRRTFDGFSDIGTLESCVRPGYFDNSHVGANGMPTKARIGDTEVYIDVCHGVHNRSLTKDGDFEWKMIYMPFFRVKDYETGDLLYYSQEPILDMDDVWREYAENGRWIKLIPHIYILFAGGQIEAIEGRNGLDDEFSFYNGAGDTAITRGTFTIRDLLPDSVIEDIQVRKIHRSYEVSIPENKFCFEKTISGWNWSIQNNSEKRTISVTRKLEKANGNDFAERAFNTAPGYFDADIMFFDGKSVKFIDNVGWCIIYKGICWTEIDGIKNTNTGFGVLVLDSDNPEKLLYRSTEPLNGELSFQEGWTTGEGIEAAESLLDNIENYIPKQVLFEIRRANSLINEGKHWQSHHTLWLQKRAEN